MSDARQVVMNYLRDLCANEQVRSALTEDTDLLAAGVLDSFGIVQLIQFIEKEFDIRIPDGDIGPDLFASAAALGGYVERRQA